MEFLTYREISESIILFDEEKVGPLNDIIVNKKTYEQLVKIRNMYNILTKSPGNIKVHLEWDITTTNNYSEKGYGIN